MAYARNLALRLAALLPALVLGTALAGTPAGGVRAAEWPSDAYVLQIDGLACPYCGYGVEKQFQKQDGVKRTEIDIEKGVALVHMASGTSFSDKQLRQFVHDAGFELGKILHRPEGS